MDRPNLTVLTNALVTRVALESNRATGVEICYQGSTLTIGARLEVVLSLGAIHTPKVLMYSGIGDETQLRRAGITVRQHLPGVGHNLQDHVALYCVWQDRVALPPRNNMAESTVYWTMSDSDTPDVFICQAEVPIGSDETIARFGLPPTGWTLAAGISHPKSRGRLRLTGPSPLDPIHIDANTFDDPRDLKAAITSVELCREIGNSDALQPFVSREVMPEISKAATSRTSSATPPPATGTKTARRRWGATAILPSTHHCASTGSKAYASPTPRSCREAPPATPWPHA